uniref:RING-type E3 ubiquitin transferase n=1 Tax=Gossypium raimondii TaxID=29730 RepID=A0A0D2SCR1_GOSRA|nr:hypothetical protein B456_007G133700 [Gossypium raimondii]
MVPWGGPSCCLSAAALYLLGRSSGSKMIPIIVTISGRVGSETPINCRHSGLRGVIVEGTAEQHFLKHNDAGSWIQDSALMLSMCKEVPWYLVRTYFSLPVYFDFYAEITYDDETGRVYVVGARGAVGFALTVGSEVFEESGRSIMLGVKRIEQVLPTGSSLTVVGEAVKDDIGTIRIQKPQKGPFYVSPKSIDQLVSNLGKWARWYKYASFGLTIFGVFLITKHAIHYYLERRRRWELRRRVLAAAAKRTGSDNEDSTLKAENGTGTNQDCVMPDLCVICLEQEYNAVFIQRIEQVVKVFRH